MKLATRSRHTSTRAISKSGEQRHLADRRCIPHDLWPCNQNDSVPLLQLFDGVPFLSQIFSLGVAGLVHAVPQTPVVGAVAYFDGGQIAPRELLRCIKTFL